MAKRSTLYICQQCGYKSPQYLGRCPECQSWGSLVETISLDLGKGIKSTSRVISEIEVLDIALLQKQEYQRINTPLSEFDRVLGGGIVKGSVVLVSGDPGIGKSTLLTQMALNIENSLYVAGEESAHQIKMRVDRMKRGAHLAVLNEVDVDNIVLTVEARKPNLVIIDSIQTLQTIDLAGIAGSVGQVRECSHRLQQIAKRLHIPIFLVGHITKEGTIAGPKTLEHLVDVVLTIEGDPCNNFRVLRASKNRFGPTDEVGIFEMEESGMQEVTNPSKLFLDQRVDAPGSAITAIMSGFRPLLVEIQALVTKTYLPIPRRSGSGIDNNRLQLLVAVLSKRLNLPLYDQDIFVNVTGGLRVIEPAADLAICMAIISSLKNKTLSKQAVFIGEVGLLGEIRSVQRLEKRVIEAKKMGFTQIISPASAKTLDQATTQSFGS